MRVPTSIATNGYNVDISYKVFKFIFKTQGSTKCKNVETNTFLVILLAVYCTFLILIMTVQFFYACKI